MNHIVETDARAMTSCLHGQKGALSIIKPCYWISKPSLAYGSGCPENCQGLATCSSSQELSHRKSTDFAWRSSTVCMSPSKCSLSPSAMSEAPARVPRLPRKVPRRSRVTKPGPRAPPSAMSEAPATQNDRGCEIVPRLPREIKVDVTKCHACHAKCRGATGVTRD